jgi:hypothetical protein
MMRVMSDGAGKEGEGYLRAYDQDLAGALGLLVHDLVVTLHWKPEKAESLVWEWADRWLDPNHFWPGSEGPTTGGELLLRVADALQEWIIESVDNTWPTCPVDRSHPLWLRPEMEPSAMWTCPTDGRPIARLGELIPPPVARRTGR